MEAQVEWLHWCRLCARDSAGDSDNIDLTADADSMRISTAIGKFFWVNIKPGDVAKFICKDCYELINSLIDFTERINKVQAMFLILESNAKPLLDPSEVRTQFGLLDDDWEHIIQCTTKKENLIIDKENDSNYEDDDNQDTPVVMDFEVETSNEAAKESENEVKMEIKGRTFEASSPTHSISSEHLIDKATSERSDEEFEANNTSQLKSCGKYKCSVCNKMYKNATSYRKHLQTHNLQSDLPDFTCNKCEKVFPTEKQLLQHGRTHLPLEQKLTVPCPFCDKKYINETVMKHHVLHMHKEKSYVCEVCGLKLKRLASLNDHKLIHSDVFAFKCELCGRSFKNKARLKAHKDAVHSNTSFQCSQCDAILNSKRTLKMHMLVHTNEKEHKCNFCNAEFKRGKALKNHLLIHIGLRPYKCNFCEKTFTNGSNCRSHKKRLHPVELAAEEAAGNNRATLVPKIDELRASESIQEPRSIARGGITPKMRALLIAAEKIGTPTKSSPDTRSKNRHKEALRLIHIDSDDETKQVIEIETEELNSACFEEELDGETVVFEVVNEVDVQ